MIAELSQVQGEAGKAEGEEGIQEKAKPSSSSEKQPWLGLG